MKTIKDMYHPVIAIALFVCFVAGLVQGDKLSVAASISLLALTFLAFDCSLFGGKIDFGWHEFAVLMALIMSAGSFFASAIVGNANLAVIYLLVTISIIFAMNWLDTVERLDIAQDRRQKAAAERRSAMMDARHKLAEMQYWRQKYWEEKLRLVQ